MTQGRTEYSIAGKGNKGRAARINHVAADVSFARTNPALPPLVT
jgi:hypothetical protein